MTIAERRAREEFDRLHPWQPIADACKPQLVGVICELRISFHHGAAECGHKRFFHNGQDWFQIEPPNKLGRRDPIMEFRSTGVRLGERRMRRLLEKSGDQDWEFRGGHIYQKPQRYKLYWRAND